MLVNWRWGVHSKKRAVNLKGTRIPSVLPPHCDGDRRGSSINLLLGSGKWSMTVYQRCFSLLGDPWGREAWDGEGEGRQGKVKGQRKRGGTFLEEGNWGKERTITKLYPPCLKGFLFSFRNTAQVWLLEITQEAFQINSKVKKKQMCSNFFYYYFLK